MEQQELLFIANGNWGWYNHFVRQFSSFFFFPTIVLPYDPAGILLGIYANKLKHISTQNLPMKVYRSFIHNCQKLMSFSRYMYKQTVVPPNNRILFTGKKKLAIKKWARRNLKCPLLSEEAHPYCMIPMVWHFWKGKIWEAVKRSVVARDLEGWAGWTQGNLAQWNFSVGHGNVGYKSLYTC